MSTQEIQPEQVQPTREIASINGKHYFKDSMSKDVLMAFEQALELNDKILEAEKTVRDLKYARQYLIEYIEKKADSLEEYIPPQTTPSETPQENPSEK